MSSETSSAPQELIDELICIADFKLVLGGWYMVVIPNGRSVGDWCALCGMLQDHYGHARAVYRFLATLGVAQAELDTNRDAVAIRGPAVLDASPSSWTDFIATAFLAEQMLDRQLRALAAPESPEPRLALLAKKICRESRFHQAYVSGWLRSLLASDPGATADVLASRFERALDWWPADAASDAVNDAGFRSADIGVRDDFVAAVNDSVDNDEVPALVATSADRGWQRATRRGDGRVGIPQKLHEAIRFRNIELATT